MSKKNYTKIRLKVSTLVSYNFLSSIRFGFIFLCISMQPHLLYAAQEVTEESLEEMRNHIEILKKDLVKKESKKSKIKDSLYESKIAINEATLRLVKIARDRYLENKKLDQLKNNSKQIKISISMQQTRLNKILYQQYINEQQAYSELLFSQQDLNGIARKLHYYNYFSRIRSESIGALRINLKQLETLEQETNKRASKIISTQLKQKKQKRILKIEEIKHQKFLMDISKQVAEKKQELNKLRHNEKRLSHLVNKLGKLLLQKNNITTPSNDKLPSTSTGESSFFSLKGYLNLPVNGELTNQFGGLRLNGKVTWKGLFIRSSIGENVKAIANGQIVFADWLRGFGNLVIIDHGAGYMSLYGGNENILKRVGDTIKSRDAIATVGNSGDNADPGLYFELRHKGKPFNPLDWIQSE